MKPKKGFGRRGVVAPLRRTPARSSRMIQTPLHHAVDVELWRRVPTQIMVGWGSLVQAPLEGGAS